MSGTWASGWVAGDIVTAAEFAKGAGAIANSTLTGSAVSIDLTSLPTSYAHLLILAYIRTDRAATLDNLSLRFNNDSTAIYDYNYTVASASGAPSSVAATAQTAIRIAPNIPGATATANRFGCIAFLVNHYAGTANHKVATGNYWSLSGTTTADVFTGTCGGNWRSAAAISRITIFPELGTNLVSGCRVTVYGLGA